MTPTTKKRILIVDDHEDTAQMFAFTLEEYYQTRIELHRDDALKVFIEFQPDLILLDRFMEGPPFDLFVKEVRHIQKSVKIILVSAAIHAVEDAKALGIAHMSKPIEPLAIRALVKSLLS